MHLKKNVEKFLVDQKIEKNIVEVIKKRMDKVSGGIAFTSGYLKYIMGNNELTQRYIWRPLL